MSCCNSRLRGRAEALPKRPPGEYGGEGYCDAHAGAGTQHEGEGRCYRHGGATRGAGAPPGNANAVTTGEHETIRPEDLTDEERARLDAMPTDADWQTALLIRLTVLRLRRMQQRVERLHEEGGAGLAGTERSTERGRRSGRDVDVSTERECWALGLIMEIEESITRLQGVLIRVLRLRHEVTGGAEAQPEESADLLAAAVQRATAQLGEAEDE